jgi:hypothetical protein
MTTTAFPPGLYRIDVAGSGEPQSLTRLEGGRVTILPIRSPPDREQEVIRCFMTSSIVCCSPTLLVANQPW